jgi:transcription initiation factor TFIIIB Brf1 subunit/transcription initiation factor TFIIB
MECPECGEPGAKDVEPGIHACDACGAVWSDSPLPFPPLPDPRWMIEDDDHADR